MKNNLVYARNDLLRSSFFLQTTEFKLLVAFISLVDSRERISADTYYYINIAAYADWAGISHKSAKEDIEDIVYRLHKRYITYINDAGREISTSWISTVARYDGNTIGICWSAGIIPFISGLSNRFTKFPMKVLGKFSSGFGLRMYTIFCMELLEKKRNNVNVTLTIEQIHTLFKFDGKYNTFTNLNRWVITPGLADINKNSNIKVSLLNEFGKKMYIKEGKKVVGICFNVSWRKNVTKSISEN